MLVEEQLALFNSNNELQYQNIYRFSLLYETLMSR